MTIDDEDIGEPARLVAGDATELEARLLRSATGDAPPAGASERALVALGLAVGVGAAATTAEAAAATAKVATAGTTKVVAAATAKSAAATATAGGAATGGGAAVGGSMLAWLAGGVIAIGSTMAIVDTATRAVTPPRAASVSPAPAPPASQGDREAEPGAGYRASGEVSEPHARATGTGTGAGAGAGDRSRTPETGDRVPSAQREVSERGEGSRTPEVATPGHAPSPSSSSPLAREVALLDEARGALGRGDAARAAALLDTYDRDFPAGSLAPESRRLRAQVRAMGDAP